MVVPKLPKIKTYRKFPKLQYDTPLIKSSYSLQFNLKRPILSTHTHTGYIINQIIVLFAV